MGTCVSSHSAATSSRDERDGQEEEEREEKEANEEENQNEKEQENEEQDSSYQIFEPNHSEIQINEMCNWDDSKLFSFMGSKANAFVITLDTISNESLKTGSQNQNDIDGYKKVRLLGAGSSSEVLEMEKNGVHYAVKICSIKKNTYHLLNADSHKPREEAQKMMNFQHPYVLKLFEFIEKKTALCLVTELCIGGTILKFEEINKQRLAFAQTCCAVEYIHKMGYAHRDIKCENILLDDNDVIRLCDFGISEFVGETEKLSYHMMKGTATYSAPEVFHSNPYDLFKADIWSLGVLLYRIVLRKQPYIGKNLCELEKAIMNTSLIFNENVDNDLIILIQGLLEKNPDKRFTFKNIWQSKWMQGLETLVKNFE